MTKQAAQIAPASHAPPTSAPVRAAPAHAPLIQRLQHALGNQALGALIQRQVNATRGPSSDVDRKIQRLPLMRPATKNEEAAAPPGVSQVLTSGGGGALDSGARAFFEPRFGYNFD